MSQAKKGDTVRVHYTGRLPDGEVFESSREVGLLEVTLGAGRVISGVERAIEGMSPGDTKCVDVPATEAFGQRREDKIFQIERNAMPESVDPLVGQPLQVQTQDGHPLQAVVTQVSESTVTLDANHPLAGKDLTFELEMVEIT